MVRLASCSLVLACSLDLAAALTTRAFLAADKLPSFDAFVAAHGRDFEVGSTEYVHRKGIYKRRLEEIQRHNAVPDRRWTAGVNHLSDRTDDEFQSRLGWRHAPRAQQPSARGSSLLELERTMPFQHDGEVSYMNLSVANEVPDQGGCGSCWAVATSQLLNAHYEITFGKPASFSAQDLVSCVPNPKNCGGKGGCDGATVELAMEYGLKSGGFKTLAEVPYEGATGICGHSVVELEQVPLDADGRQVFNGMSSMAELDPFPAASAALPSLGFGALKGFTTLESNKVDPLLKALYEVGPVAVTVAAGDWSLYSRGVFDGCENPTLNHAVLLMGISKEPRAYNIKNSWGSGWGENGYIRLLRTADEDANCATDLKPKDGVACDGPETPSSVKTCGTCGILYDSVVPYFDKKAGKAVKQDIAQQF